MMEPILSVRHLGTQIKQIRKREGWTHAEVAEWLGVGTRFLFDLARSVASVAVTLSFAKSAKQMRLLL